MFEMYISELKHVQANAAMSAGGRIQTTSTNCYHIRGLFRIGIAYDKFASVCYMPDHSGHRN